MLYQNKQEFKDLVALKDSIRMDLDKHDEHNALEYAVEEIEYLQSEKEYLEEIVHNLEESLVDLDKAIDIIEKYYSSNLERLKDRAKLRGLKTSGTKAELVRRLFEDNRDRGELSGY